MLCIAFLMPCLFTYLLFSFYGLKGTLDKCNFTVLALRCFILECKFCLVFLMRELFNLTWIMYFPSLFYLNYACCSFFPFHYWCCLLTSCTVKCFVLYHDFSMVHTRIRSTQSVLLSDRVELLVKKRFLLFVLPSKELIWSACDLKLTHFCR